MWVWQEVEEKTKRAVSELEIFDDQRRQQPSGLCGHGDMVSYFKVYSYIFSIWKLYKCLGYIAGYFRGVLIFIMFVVCLQVTQPTNFSTHVIGASTRSNSYEK